MKYVHGTLRSPLLKIPRRDTKIGCPNPFVLVVLFLILLLCGPAAVGGGTDANSVFLFTSFREPGQDGLRFLYSFDGYHWTNVPGTFLKPSVGSSKLMR